MAEPGTKRLIRKEIGIISVIRGVSKGISKRMSQKSPKKRIFCFSEQILQSAPNTNMHFGRNATQLMQKSIYLALSAREHSKRSLSFGLCYVGP